MIKKTVMSFYQTIGFILATSACRTGFESEHRLKESEKDENCILDPKNKNKLRDKTGVVFVSIYK